MKKIIAFSLWGEDPKYCEGAVRNAHLALEIYPGWTCRFYVSANEYPFTIREWHDTELGHAIGQLKTMRHVEIVTVSEPADWSGMFWRFHPAFDSDVDVFISRDCDSRLSRREAEAVEDWLCGPKLIHVMRDHPHHNAPIMGGMWGAKRGAIPDIEELLALYFKGKENSDYWQVDQDFLRDLVWPKYYHKVLAHDDWERFRHPAIETKPFPSARENQEFVGAIIGPSDERLHSEHHEML